MYKTTFSRILRFRRSLSLYSCLKDRHFSSSFAVRWYSKKFTDFSKRGNNVILMGSPGCGKTTVGRILAARLGKQVIDVDNDHLEKIWRKTVAAKLTEVGSDGFVEAEGQALLQLSCDDSVISLSGSNPMHQEAMRHVHSLGTVIYLDVCDTDILERLEQMKVDRIVGQNDGTSLADILKYRKQFYEGNYDLRILCERNESPESITSKVVNSVNSLNEHNGFISTRHRKAEAVSEKRFFDVVLEGLAPDGGLFVPDHDIPRMTLGEFERLVPLTFQERALRILEQWISPHELHPSQLKHMIDSAYHDNFQHVDIAPVVKVEEPIYALELFHGPTASFKDLALQLTPFFFSKAVSLSLNRKTKYLILVATTGDTGSAVLEGFRDCDSTDVLVLYPANGVSSIQRRHMKTTDSLNSMVLGVDGDFDFCQTAIKKIFNDTSFCRYLQNSFNVKLSAANSINWGRLLPQVIYHVSSYLELVKQGVLALGEKADTCVPTGNFGNILAAYYAKEMGVPFDNVICASNVNNVLTDFFQNGVYDISGRSLHQTASPSIDIFKSSNLERLLYHITSHNSELVMQLFSSLEKDQRFQVDQELKTVLSSTIKSGWCSEQDCLSTIKTVFNTTGYLLDPHTAIAKTVADNFISTNKPMIISATAHYGRFAYNVLKALGIDKETTDPLALMEELQQLQAHPPIHKHLVQALRKPEIHNQVCGSDVDTVKEHIETFLRLKTMELKWGV